MIDIPKSIVKRIPYVAPITSTIGISLDVKEILESSSSPFAGLKFVGKRFAYKCKPPELFLAGKYLMVASGVAASFYSVGNPLIVSAAISSLRALIKK